MFSVLFLILRDVDWYDYNNMAQHEKKTKLPWH